MTNRNLENFYNPKLFQQLGCTLQAYGANFDPEAFLKDSNFPQHTVLFKGKLGLPDEFRKKIKKAESSYQSALDVFDTPYLLSSVSEASKLQPQIEEAISFLKRYVNKLGRLKNHTQVENVLMRFSVEDYEAGKLMEFPEELTELYTELGMGVLIGK